MYEFFRDLDRRWIFLLMLLAVAIPILLQLSFPEKPTGLAEAVFNEIEALEAGAPVLLAFDFDPGSEGELAPMATAFTLHCAQKKLKMFYVSLWPVGPQMIVDAINRVIKPDFPQLEYGEDYVNLGYKPGYEGVIKVIVTDLRELYTTDDKGTNVDQIPMMEGIHSVQDFDLVINVSAGYAGTKEWVQYAATPFRERIRLVAGCTGVQAPLLYPYIPEQLPGLLGAIKGAAEYEKLTKASGTATAGMDSQSIVHILIILLIVIANISYFAMRKKAGQ